MITKATQNIEKLHRIASNDLKSATSDLFFLSVNPLLHQILDNNNSVVKQKLEEDFCWSEGQFISSHGIYTFTTVYLLHRGMLSSTGSDNAFNPSVSMLSDKNSHWKIVSLITNEQLKEVRTIILFSWWPYLTIITLVIVLISFLLSHAVRQREKAIEERLKREKLQGVLEMTGAVCHEINQPLMTISGYSELLLHDIPENTPEHKSIKAIFDQSQRIGSINKKIMKITKYKTKGYLKGKIIDIDAASSGNNSDTN